MSDLYRSELLRVHEHKMLIQAWNGMENNQSFCKVDPRQLYNMIVEMDKAQIELARLREAQRWTAVNERLPQFDQPVLTYGHGLISVCTYTANYLWIENEGYVLSDDEEPFYWMPLPEPPALEVNP